MPDLRQTSLIFYQKEGEDMTQEQALEIIKADSRGERSHVIPYTEIGCAAKVLSVYEELMALGFGVGAQDHELIIEWR